MRVIVTGGTGFVGRALCQELRAAGHQPVVLTRNRARAQERLGSGVEIQDWDPSRPSDLRDVLEGADAIVNLAGAPIDGQRWTAAYKAAIRESRVQATRALVEAMRQSAQRPRVLVNASATGYYGPRGDELVDEQTPPGADFLAQVCQAWEQEARAAEALGVRVALVRTGVVLGRGGGALARMLLPYRLFVGGPIGSGRQGFPWVHLADVVGIYRWAVENDAVNGPLNATGPQPLTNREFSEALGRALGRPSWLPVPGLALKLLFGELAETALLQGQKVVPVRTEQLGYQFRFRTVEAALRDLFGRG